MRVHPLAPVVALDLDGTLAAYHKHFIWFASLYLQEPVVPVWSYEMEGDFASALGMERAEYRRIKLAYRQGGMKRSLPLIDPATRSHVSALRSQGAQVWITTTRPWNRLDNIDPDTQFWIDRNVGQVDGLIYGEDKYSDLLDIVGRERILGVFDDIPDNMREARRLGLPAILSRGHHNQWYWDEAPFRASGLGGAMPMIEGWIDDWAAQYPDLAATGSATGSTYPRAPLARGLATDQPDNAYDKRSAR